MNKFKKIILSLVAVSFLIMPGIVGASSSITFTDLDKSYSHYDAIMELANKGVINGYTAKDGTKEYRPEQDLQRNHSALMFTRILELPTPTNVSEVLNDLVDVDENTMYADSIAATVQAKIFTGNSKKEYMPLQDLTRQQMATVLVNAFEFEPKSKADSADINLTNVAESHKGNVQILADHGITNQLSDFRPIEPVTRGQFASFLKRSMDVANGDVVEVPEPKPEEPEKPTEPETTIKEITLGGLTDVVEGEVTPITVNAVHKDGEVESITGKAKFSVADTSILVIEDGNVRAKNAGTTKVTVTYEGFTSSATYTVLTGANSDQLPEELSGYYRVQQIEPFFYNEHQDILLDIYSKAVSEYDIGLTAEEMLDVVGEALESNSVVVRGEMAAYYDRKEDVIQVRYVLASSMDWSF